MIKTTATITASHITIEDQDNGFPFRLVASEERPATFAAADTMLAFHGYGRAGSSWELTPGGSVSANVQRVDNTFKGVTAARLWERIGTTHGQNFLPELASEVEPGWLITDREQSEVYLVAGQSVELETAKIHMVSEGKTWDERHTGEFGRDTIVWVSRPKG
jgi:hypothetical protein